MQIADMLQNFTSPISKVKLLGGMWVSIIYLFINISSIYVK